MPNTQHNGEFPLPPNWGMATDFDGKIYFIDHINKETTWLDPRDRITKPHTFADCVGDELPIGWEESHDPLIGRYYINHIDQTTQLEDPRKEWKTVQEAMLRDYLIAAQDNLDKKKEIFDVKQQRLLIAQDEYNKMVNLATSRSSLYSSSSSISTRHDPDSIRAELVLAKERVRLLKQELSHITNDISLTQRGVDKLYSVEQKINSHHNGCYDISEVQAIRQEMLKVQKSLVSGEKVREELVQSLVQIKNELMRQQDDHHLNTSSAAAAAAVAAAYHDRVCVASQTDLYVDNMMNSGARYAEMAKTKLQYSEWRKRIKQLQQQIAEHVEKIEPNKLESDKDRLLLIQEKEKLLSELRSTSLKHKTPEEIAELQQTCKKLEDELKKANQTTNQCLVNRLRLHEDKQLLLVKLQEALKSTKMLEDRLKSFSSESTFSISSGSSMGSLSTASSKSALSFTDIYLDPLTVDPAIMDVNEMHRCSQRLSSSHASASEISLSPRSSLSMETPPASPMKYSDQQGKEEPTYANAMNFALIQQHQQPSTSSLASSHSDWDCMRLEELKMIPSINLAGQLSPIFEKPTLLNLPQDMLSRSSSTSNTRSVSAAVSNESVAGDSGVFEASRAHLPRKELAQVQIGMKYIEKECILVVAVERASNLAALMPSPNSQIYLRAALLPNSLQSIRTKSVTDFQKPVFGDNFAIPISLDKILRKSLQITVVSAAGQREEIIGAVQISLAEFNAEDNTLKWYNILSSKFLPHETIEISGACKEESSDDSTIISSQTSTLTRNQGPSFDAQAQIAEELKEHLNFGNEEEEEDEEDEEVDEMDPDNEAEAEQTQNMLANYMNTIKQEYVEKETNTECAFPPEKSRLLYPQVQPSTSKDALNGVDDRPVKRSQTFSPSVEKGRYICRLNRSDSDSAMHFVPTPFQRGAVERRSLRFQTKVPKQHSTKLSHTHIPRTSLDLELDLQAQHSKLDNLNDEIDKLKNLEQTLKTALDNKDPKIAMWARESEEFQRLVDRADSSKSPEEKQLQKLLHKTAKEVYKLRRTKIPKGSADLTSFKQKMLFFTSRKGGVSVPELPSELYVPEGIDEVEEENEDEEEVEQTTNISQLSSTVNNNQHDGHLNLSTTELNLTNNHKSLELNTSPTLPANTCVPNRGPPPPYPTAINSLNGGSPKFDYVIDRKYGVEV